MSYHFNYKTYDGAVRRMQFENAVQGAKHRWSVVRFKDGAPDTKPLAAGVEYQYKLKKEKR